VDFGSQEKIKESRKKRKEKRRKDRTEERWSIGVMSRRKV